jgi:hypothetical protein
MPYRSARPKGGSKIHFENVLIVVAGFLSGVMVGA